MSPRVSIACQTASVKRSPWETAPGIRSCMTTIQPSDAVASLLPPTGPLGDHAPVGADDDLELLEAATWRILDADAVVGSDARLHALRLAD